MDIIDSRVERILQTAASAPSVYNTQPWQVEVAGREVTVRADASRQLHHRDPHGREMLISCGAFLFNLQVAARRESLSAVTAMLPDLADNLLVAKVVLEPGPPPGVEELELSVAAARRGTSRLPFDDQPLSADVLEVVRRAALAEGASLCAFQASSPLGVEVIGLERRAEALAAEDPVAREEELAWIATAPERNDGIPRAQLGPVPDDDRAPARRFLAGAGTARFERRSTMAALTTPGDSARDWLTAGRALEHVLLAATSFFVHASFATTVLENPTTRHDLRRLLPVEGAPQMLLRLGYSVRPQHTPRRSLHELTDTAGRAGAPRPA